MQPVLVDVDKLFEDAYDSGAASTQRFAYEPLRSVAEAAGGASSADAIVMLQPAAEVTRHVYFNVRVRFPRMVSLENVPVSAILEYEDGKEVDGGDDILEAQYAIRGGDLHVRARVTELSKNHRGLRFRITVRVASTEVRTAAFRVMSKTCIVRSHLYPEEARAAPKRKLSPAPTVPIDVAEQIAQQRSEIAELRHSLADLTHLVTQLVRRGDVATPLYGSIFSSVQTLAEPQPAVGAGSAASGAVFTPDAALSQRVDSYQASLDCFHAGDFDSLAKRVHAVAPSAHDIN